MCGIVGFWRSDGQDVARQLKHGLWVLQPRGHESAGVAVWNAQDEKIYRKVGQGKVAEALPDSVLTRLHGSAGIAQNRYSTAGASTLQNAQPVMGEFLGKPFALAHNGNLLNKKQLRRECRKAGFRFCTTSDTGVMAAMISLSQAPTMTAALFECARKWIGAFSILVLYDGEIYALRDQWGVRPLHLGVIRPTVVFGSESCLSMHYRIPEADMFDVPPGGFVHMRRDGTLVRWHWTEPEDLRAICSFEYVYFTRTDSAFDGVRVMLVRERSGEILACEAPPPHDAEEGGIDADLVVPVPDSGKSAARGYARKLNLPYEDEAIFRLHERTFIDKNQELRRQGILLKFTAIPEKIRGKRVVVVDDSLVRNNTAPAVVALLREAGAKKVHWRNASPPVRWGCYYGIDTYREIHRLAMRRHNDKIEAIRQECGADSLAYLSLEGLMRAIKEVSGGKLDESSQCTACWSGEYRIPGTPSVEDQLRLVEKIRNKKPAS